MDGFVEQKTDAVPGLQALVKQIARRLICAIVELAKRQGDILGDDRQMIGGHLVDAFFEVMIEPLALSPARRIVVLRVHQHSCPPIAIRPCPDPLS